MAAWRVLSNGSSSVMVLLCLLSLLAVHVQAWSTVSPSFQARGIAVPTNQLVPYPRSQSTFALRASSDDKEDDDDDDDEESSIDDTSLGDWRKFRASLIDGGLPSAPSSTATTTKTAGSSTKSNKKKSVAAKNEELLAKQNEKLAEEYRTGVWAHTVPDAEVGGLLCRLPLEAELFLGKIPTSNPNALYWKDKLDLMVSLERMDERKTKEENLDDTQDLADAATLAQVETWFEAAERMITSELQSMVPESEEGKPQVILNPDSLGEKERLLLDKYMSYKQTWQEICLVTAHNPETGCSESLIINRPIAKSINKQLAVYLLDGSDGSGKGRFAFDFMDKLVQAFGNEAGVYMGGPDGQEGPALLIHGISNLEGATELAPGTSIYQGGWEAAVEGVLNGTYKPLDFRFFMGRQTYDPKENPKRGNLVALVTGGAYQPVACARSVALKQCLGLPKPLWHEVLELCGGELKAISSIELRKRIDLQ